MRTAIVTGANRGVGRGIARQLALLGYRVILTSRDEVKGKQTIDELQQAAGANLPGEFIYHRLDVTDGESIERLCDFVVAEYAAADVLINNAAVLLDQYGRVLQTPLGGLTPQS